MNTVPSAKKRHTSMKRLGIGVVGALLLSLLAAGLPAGPVAADTAGPDRVDGTMEPYAPGSITTAAENGYLKVTFTKTPEANPAPTKSVITTTQPTGVPVIYEVRNLTSAGGGNLYLGSSTSAMQTNVCSGNVCTFSKVALAAAGNYAASVYANNASGNSPEIYAQPVTLEAPASSPGTLQGEVVGSGLKVSFNQVSALPNTTAITKYTIVVQSPTGAPVFYEIRNPVTNPRLYLGSSTSSIATGVCSAAVGSLPAACQVTLPVIAGPGQYSLQAYASNSAGNGPSATWELEGGLNSTSSVARNYIVTQNGNKLRVEFDLPVPADDEPPVTTFMMLIRKPASAESIYEIRSPYNAPGSTLWSTYAISGYACKVVPTEQNHCLVDLPVIAEGGTYTVELTAVNSGGRGATLTREFIHSPPAAAPTALKLAASSAGIGVTFTGLPATNLSESKIEKYVVIMQRPTGVPSLYEIRTPTAGGGSAYLLPGPNAVKSNVCPVDVDGEVKCSFSTGPLTEAGPYRFSAYAVNAAGNGPTASSGLLEYGETPSQSPLVPQPPSGVALNKAADGSFTLTMAETPGVQGVSTDGYQAVLLPPTGLPEVLRIYKQAGAWYRTLGDGNPTTVGVNCDTGGCTASLAPPAGVGIYKVAVFATNAAGNSNPQETSFEALAPQAPIAGVANFTGKTLTFPGQSPLVSSQ